MNMAANSDKMAVTDNQSIIPVHGSESREDNDVKHQGKSNNDGIFKKKSTFKITSVTKNPDAVDISNDADHDVEHDSMDDLDETVESHTEDASSEILDISKHTDGGELASPMEEETSDHVTNNSNVKDLSNPNIKTEQASSTNPKESTNVKELTSKEKEKSDQQGPHSTRFKVVKVETREPFKRGRWTCLDTLDYPAPDKSDTKLNIADSNPAALSTTNSTHHMGGVIDDPSKNPAKSTNVIQNESKENFHVDNYQNPSTTRQSQSSTQPQIQQTVSSNVQSNVAQQQIQTHPSVSNFHNSTIHSQPISNVNTSVAQGKNSMQTSDKPQTTYVYGGPVTGQMPNAIQNVAGSNVDKNVHFNKEQYVSSDNVIPNVDNKELNSAMYRTMGANIQQNSPNIEVQGAILTPQSVAEVVGMIPSPQEEDRCTRRLSDISPLTPGARYVGTTNNSFSHKPLPSFTGSSTVAIDNKIEQAMDLVKSHLMYAVREEVEVLKEQIKELMDKNSQLEYENQILKNSASPETLAKLGSLPPSSSS